MAAVVLAKAPDSTPICHCHVNAIGPAGSYVAHSGEQFA